MCHEYDRHPDSRPFRYVVVEHVTREYGGPEEGGWWFDYPRRIAVVKVRNKRHAAKVAARLTVEFEYLHDPQSLGNYHSGGQVMVRVRRCKPAPFAWPHYE